LGLLATSTLEVVPFREYPPFPTLLAFFKCILKVVICEGVKTKHAYKISLMPGQRLFSESWGNFGNPNVRVLASHFSLASEVDGSDLYKPPISGHKY
jgi:hypothetical protein